jgi:hypothetical protein
MRHAPREPHGRSNAVGERAAARSGGVDAGGVLALRSAYGTRAFGQILRRIRRLQRSPQSEALRALGANVELNALLAALKGMSRSDGDVDAELTTLLKDRQDDLWLAQSVRAGEVGKSAQKAPIEVNFFPGKTTRRALVIAGVHGTERQGIQVAEMLKADLAANPAGFSVILVPKLFPDNAAPTKEEPFGRREGDTATNRNFPSPDQDLAASGGIAAPRDKEKKGKPILSENQMLMHLMERFQPERIITLHGTRHTGAAGVFYDPRELTAAERKPVEDEAARRAAAATHPRATDSEGGQEARQRDYYEALVRQGVADKKKVVATADEELSLKAAKMIEAQTSGVTGREARPMEREKEKVVSDEQREARRKHGSVAGNVGASGEVDTAFWSGTVEKGVSLGQYASGRGMSIFTVEPPVNRNVADYGPKGNKAGDKLTQADRQKELQAYADAVRTVLLAQ